MLGSSARITSRKGGSAPPLRLSRPAASKSKQSEPVRRSKLHLQLSRSAVALLCGLMLLASGCGASEEHELRWHDTQPAWSPDGHRIAFVRGRRWFGLHVLDLRTGRVRRLAPAGKKVSDSQPAWSPDGRSILFVRTIAPRDANSNELYRVDVNGRRLMRLTRNRAIDALSQPGHPTGSSSPFCAPLSSG